MDDVLCASITHTSDCTKGVMIARRRVPVFQCGDVTGKAFCHQIFIVSSTGR